MKCRDCKYMFTNKTLDGLYICVNGDSENFGGYTGLCSEDECEDGVRKHRLQELTQDIKK